MSRGRRRSKQTKSSRAKIATAIEVITYALDELPDGEAILATAELLRRLHGRLHTLIERLQV